MDLVGGVPTAQLHSGGLSQSRTSFPSNTLLAHTEVSIGARSRVPTMTAVGPQADRQLLGCVFAKADIRIGLDIRHHLIRSGEGSSRRLHWQGTGRRDPNLTRECCPRGEIVRAQVVVSCPPESGPTVCLKADPFGVRTLNTYSIRETVARHSYTADGSARCWPRPKATAWWGDLEPT